MKLKKTTLLFTAAVTLVSLFLTGCFSQTELESLRAEIDLLSADNEQLATELANAQNDLYEANDRITILESEISDKNTLFEEQQTTNTALTEELNKIKNPKLFSSQSELADWLFKDKTDTIAADYDPLHQAYVLQIAALRDGYILPADVDITDGDLLISNSAIIQDEFLWVYAWDDDIVFATYIDPIPMSPYPTEE